MKLSTFNAFKNISLKEGMVEIKGDKLLDLQNVLLEMLVDLDSVCRRCQITYFLSGGSMLGAVRHHGFIPWDDDVDVFMTRKEFNHFKEVFNEEMDSKYYLQTPENTQDYGISVPKIRKKGTVVKTKEDKDDPDNCGAWIDIFILENTYNNRFLRLIHEILCLGFGFALSCRMFYSRKELYLQILNDTKEQEKICKTKIRIGRIFSLFSLDTWTKWTLNIYSMCKNDDSRLVVCPSGRKHFNGEIFPRDSFCNVQEHDFEDKRLFISRWYDGYLKIMYGDYMTIPKEEDRETHVVIEFDLGEK